MHRDRDDRRASHAIGADWPGDVLQVLGAEIVETRFDLVPNVVIGGARDNYTSWLGDRFEPCRDVYPIAVEIAALDHNVTQIDADTQHDVAFLRLAVIGSGHTLLEIDSAFHRVDGAG